MNNHVKLVRKLHPTAEDTEHGDLWEWASWNVDLLGASPVWMTLAAHEGASRRYVQIAGSAPGRICVRTSSKRLPPGIDGEIVTDREIRILSSLVVQAVQL